jgi:predicted SPOUT superfamily RNA methylase MTH1
MATDTDNFSHTTASSSFRAPKFWVAIPDSSISDQQAKRDKSIKISQLARAFSIFRVNRVYIYHDKTSSTHKNDLRILKTILGYLDTPQYLRRRLYPLTPELEFAGILRPIKAPHHKKFEDIKSIRAGEIRVGVALKFKGTMHVDVGLGVMIPCDNMSYAEEGKRVNVKFVSGHPKPRVIKASAEDTDASYWGYDIVEVPSLHTLLKEVKSKRNAEIVITSRNGSHFKLKEHELFKSLKSTRNLLIVFGAPKRAVEQILSGEGQNIENYRFTLNMFPFQGTETVRLEEAIFGTLAILNNNLQIDTTKAQHSKVDN